MGQSEGLFGEPAGVAAVAGLKTARVAGWIQREETVVAVMTGNGLKDPANGQKAAGTPVVMKPDLETLVHWMDQHDKEVSL